MTLSTEKKMLLLNEKLTGYSQKYFQENISEISDFEYDVLFNELKDLEKKFPGYKNYNSIIDKVGFQSSKAFPSFAHPVPMNSLDKVMDREEFIDFIKEREKNLQEKITNIFLSLKLDGLALELVYRAGKLLVGATRGDGTTGENITENTKMLQNIPLTITPFDPSNSQELIIIRGEVIFPKKEFNEVNRKLEKKNLPLFSNPRNAASGTMRQLNPSIVQERNMVFFAYEFTNYQDFLKKDEKLKTLERQEEYLKNWGFNTNEYNSFITIKQGLKNAFAYYDSLEEKRHNLPYEVDGIVIKINNQNQQKKLGIIGNKPRYSVAWKFPPEVKITKLLDVKFQVGRTGKITPIGVLAPITIGGASVQRVTLHNESEIILKDIHINDYVEITRSGDVIPKVLKALKEKRGADVRKIIFPQNCPICHQALTKSSAKLIFCSNAECLSKQYKNIIHFGSKEAMNIDGIGEEVIKELIDQGKIKSIVDLYKLTGEDFDEFPRMGEKLKEKYLHAIHSSKKISLGKFIYALSIRGVGQKTANNLANKFQKIDQLFFISRENLKEIHEIGEILTQDIFTFFNKPQNVTMIKELIELGVKITYQKKQEKLSHKKILFTGTLSLPRNIVKGQAENLGAEIVSTVSKSLDYLVAGEKPGSKKKKAEELGIRILNEKEFNDLIGH